MRTAVIARAVTLTAICATFRSAVGRTGIPARRGALRTITVWLTRRRVTARPFNWGPFSWCMVTSSLFTRGAFAWSAVSPAIAAMLAWRHAAWHCAIANRAIRRQAWPARNVRLLANRTTGGTGCLVARTSLVPAIALSPAAALAWFAGGPILRWSSLSHRAFLMWCVSHGRGIAIANVWRRSQWLPHAARRTTLNHTFGAPSALGLRPRRLA
jgi:hypothetical protein